MKERKVGDAVKLNSNEVGIIKYRFHSARGWMYHVHLTTGETKRNISEYEIKEVVK